MSSLFGKGELLTVRPLTKDEAERYPDATDMLMKPTIAEVVEWLEFRGYVVGSAIQSELSDDG